MSGGARPRASCRWAMVAGRRRSRARAASIRATSRSRRQRYRASTSAVARETRAKTPMTEWYWVEPSTVRPGAGRPTETCSMFSTSTNRTRAIGRIMSQARTRWPARSAGRPAWIAWRLASSPRASRDRVSRRREPAIARPAARAATRMTVPVHWSPWPVRARASPYDPPSVSRKTRSCASTNATTARAASRDRSRHWTGIIGPLYARSSVGAVARSSRVGSSGQHEPEPGQAFDRVRTDPATDGFDELLDDRQADARPAVGPVARLVDPVEALEDVGQVRGRDPVAGVDTLTSTSRPALGPDGTRPRPACSESRSGGGCPAPGPGASGSARARRRSGRSQLQREAGALEAGRARSTAIRTAAARSISTDAATAVAASPSASVSSEAASRTSRSASSESESKVAASARSPRRAGLRGSPAGWSAGCAARGRRWR